MSRMGLRNTGLDGLGFENRGRVLNEIFRHEMATTVGHYPFDFLGIIHLEHLGSHGRRMGKSRAVPAKVFAN